MIEFWSVMSDRYWAELHCTMHCTDRSDMRLSFKLSARPLNATKSIAYCASQIGRISKSWTICMQMQFKCLPTQKFAVQKIESCYRLRPSRRGFGWDKKDLNWITAANLSVLIILTEESVLLSATCCLLAARCSPLPWIVVCLSS